MNAVLKILKNLTKGCKKKFNDTYGHQAVDDCLKKVAAAIDKSVCRSSDVVTRSDKALYRSKANKRNQHCVYDPDLDGPLSE